MTNPNIPPVVITIKQSKLWTIIAVAVVIVGALVWGTCRQDAKMQEWRARYNQYRDSVATELHRSDSLKAYAKVQHDSAMASNTRADLISRQLAISRIRNRELARVTDSLSNIVLADTSLSNTARQLITGLQQQVVSLTASVDSGEIRDTERRTTILRLSGEVITERDRADGLERQLRNLPAPPPKEKLLGLIPLPSRQTSFFIGVGVGILSHLAWNHYVHP